MDDELPVPPGTQVHDGEKGLATEFRLVRPWYRLGAVARNLKNESCGHDRIFSVAMRGESGVSWMATRRRMMDDVERRSDNFFPDQ